MVLDSDKYRYRNSISDFAGQDIHAHNADATQAIAEVRNWLASESKRQKLPGGREIAERYAKFQADLPMMCAALKQRREDLTYLDYSSMVRLWIEDNR